MRGGRTERAAIAAIEATAIVASADFYRSRIFDHDVLEEAEATATAV